MVMENKELLTAIEGIVEKKIVSNVEILRSEMKEMGRDLEGKMEKMADDAAHRAVAFYEERLESLLNIKDERLPDLIEKVDTHEIRLSHVEQSSALYGTAIKKISAKVFA
jgi:hypothetical protein